MMAVEQLRSTKNKRRAIEVQLKIEKLRADARKAFTKEQMKSNEPIFKALREYLVN